ncbi:MAG TPA: hypothetical protein ENF17_01105, partial [Candidatus Aminicenantes bacterium]|nr:hypothetical protein [Candidatus Aminicenantes bacterium]
MKPEKSNKTKKRRLSWLVIFSLTLIVSLLAQERFRKSPPAPFPLPPLNIKPIESVKLSNGLQVSLFSQPDLPFTHLDLIIMTGETLSPDNLPGLATMTTRMIGLETRQLSSEKI